MSINFSNNSLQDSISSVSSLQEIAIDTTSVLSIRTFKEPLSERYFGEDFTYKVNTQETQNVILRFLSWFFKMLGDLFGFEVSTEFVKYFQVLIYIIIAAFVIYLFIRFFTHENGRTLFSKKATAFPGVDLSQQHITQVDFTILLEKALADKDYRLAIRYQYLISLKVLATQEKISWEFHKTNLDYIQELSNTSLKETFGKISYIYDYIWYGEQPIDQQKYQQAVGTFHHLKQQLNG